MRLVTLTEQLQGSARTMKILKRSATANTDDLSAQQRSRLCPECSTPGSVTLADFVRNTVGYHCIICDVAWKVDTSIAIPDVDLTKRSTSSNS